MSESNLLADLGVTSVSKYSAQEAMEMTKGGFLPRLQVANASAEICQTGAVKIGNYALVTDKNTVMDIGAEQEILFIAFRPKALRIPKDGGNPLSYFNRESDAFKQVSREAGIKDSGCLFGPEFLVWLPKIQRMGTFFFGTTSNRRSAGPILTEMNQDGQLVPKVFLMRSKMVKNGKGQMWYVPIATPSSAPIEPMPEAEELKDELGKFNNPPESVVETVPETETSGERAR